jgi:hypothetical protein
MAWTAYRNLVTDLNVRFRNRFRFALQWAREAEAVSCPAEALEAYQIAVRVLPRLAFFGHGLRVRMEALRQARGLACRAAAAALSMHDVPGAIELLEHGRGVFWSRSLHLRTPTDELPEALAERMTELSHALEADSLEISERTFKAEEFENLIEDIRATPGYERFLLPLSFEDISAVSQYGFIAIILPEKAHCNVILLGLAGGDTRHLRIPTLDIDHLRELAACLNDAANIIRNGENATRKMRIAPLSAHDGTSAQTNILSELWTSLVNTLGP